MAKKQKESQKERRAREAEARRAKFADAQAAAAQKRDAAKPNAIAPVKTEKQGKPLKSSAKAAGLKSIFVLQGGSELLTSFGRGNEAVPEKRVTDGKIASARTDNREAISAALQNKRFELRGRTTGSSDDPLEASRAPGQDLIGAKAALETRYFGKTFADNIHVQTIHAIQDISKILAVHANNIVYTLNHLDRAAAPDAEDFIGIGYLTLRNRYETYCDPDAGGLRGRIAENVRRSKQQFDAFLKNPRLAYYGNAFYRKASSEERKQGASELVVREARDIYSELALMSELRQACFHGKAVNTAKLFRLETASGDGVADARDLLDKLYAEKLRELGSFDSNSARSNFRLLFDAYGADTDEKKQALAREFYRFSVLKESKNTGYSIRTLREGIVREHEQQYADKEFDSVRSKLYTLYDFFLWRFYEERPDAAEELRAALRAARTEEEKAAIYAAAAAQCHGALAERVSGVAERLRDVVKGRVKIADLKLSDAELVVVSRAIDAVRISSEATYFTKLIYLMTLFLDGKEINDLLTTLIHAFENIDSFLSVMRSEGLDAAFTQDYAVFAKSGVIAQELRAVNSFARMTKEPISGKLVMFEDAAYLLGTSGELLEHAEELRRYLNDNVLDKEKLRTLPNGKPDTGFRNFIISNVLESRRFRYLVRYGDPRSLRTFMNSRPLIRLVLGEMPDSILRRYYELCVGSSTVGRGKLVDALVDKLTALRFADFEHVEQRANAERNLEKQRMQAMISLYLLVAYQIVKNLVYVNARYTLAYHCMERDTELLLSGEPELLRDKKQLHLTRRMLTKRRDTVEAMERKVALGWEAYNRDEWLGVVRALRREKRVCGYLHQNYARLCGADAEPQLAALSLLRAYRNNAAHLSVLDEGSKYIGELTEAKSWFYVYHFLMQRVLASKFDRTEALPEGLRELLPFAEKRRECSMDLIKVLNLAFAYNLPRYKNLSIDVLFDRNRPGKETDNT